MHLAAQTHFNGAQFGLIMPQTASGPSGPDAAAYAQSFDQSVIPYLGSPYYLRLVNSEKRARQYAAAGFHVSVTRGLAGGCADPASAVQGGSAGAACQIPLDRSDVRALWAAAADAYKNAYFRLGDLNQLKFELSEANKLADKAYGAEGTAPPRDPELVQVAVASGIDPLTIPSEAPMAASGFGVKGAIFVVGLAVALTATYVGSKVYDKRWW